MKQESTDWAFPRDWLWILSWYFVVMPMILMAGLVLSGISGIRHGHPRLFYIALFLAFIGVVLLFIARLPLYRQRKFFSFGPRELPVWHRRLYWTAYGFIGVAISALVILWMTVK